jgi:Protein of unknown function (DUF3168)
VTQIPDIEAVLTAYLTAQTGERIVGTTPNDISTPWVRLTQLDARNEATSRPERLIEFVVQLDCFAGEPKEGAQAEASELAREVRATLAEMEGVYGGVTVTDVRFSGMPRIPDTTKEPARERFVLTAHVYAHS